MVKNPQKGHVREILVQSLSHRPVRKIVTAPNNDYQFTLGRVLLASTNVSGFINTYI